MTIANPILFSLDRYREQNKFTYKEIGQKSGINPDIVSSILQCKRKHPDLHKVAQIGRAMGVDICAVIFKDSAINNQSNSTK